jgi:hypothetical protein
MAGIILLRYYIKDITYAIYNIDDQIIINEQVLQNILSPEYSS